MPPGKRTVARANSGISTRYGNQFPGTTVLAAMGRKLTLLGVLVLAPLSVKDYLENRDPALQAALDYQIKG